MTGPAPQATTTPQIGSPVRVVDTGTYGPEHTTGVVKLVRTDRTDSVQVEFQCRCVGFGMLYGGRELTRHRLWLRPDEVEPA